jgi:hypothetical protein
LYEYIYVLSWYLPGSTEINYKKALLKISSALALIWNNSEITCSVESIVNHTTLLSWPQFSKWPLSKTFFHWNLVCETCWSPIICLVHNILHLTTLTTLENMDYLKIAVFWDVRPCKLVPSPSGTRLHGITSQMTANSYSPPQEAQIWQGLLN